MKKPLGIAALAVTLAAHGCSDPPGVPDRIGSNGSYTVGGTAFDVGTPSVRRPVPNLQVTVRAAATMLGGAMGSAVFKTIATDARGMYRIEDNPHFILFFDTADDSPFKFPCAHYPVWSNNPGQDDLPVVPRTWAGDRPPSNMPFRPIVHGKVFERIGDATQSIAGAAVTLHGGAGDPPAVTNQAGFYMVCTVTSWEEAQTVTVQKSGYASATREISGGGYPDLDFELVRN